MEPAGSRLASGNWLDHRIYHQETLQPVKSHVLYDDSACDTKFLLRSLYNTGMGSAVSGRYRRIRGTNPLQRKFGG